MRGGDEPDSLAGLLWLSHSNHTVRQPLLLLWAATSCRQHVSTQGADTQCCWLQATQRVEVRARAQVCSATVWVHHPHGAEPLPVLGGSEKVSTGLMLAGCTVASGIVSHSCQPMWQLPYLLPCDGVCCGAHPCCDLGRIRKSGCRPVLGMS